MVNLDDKRKRNALAAAKWRAKNPGYVKRWHIKNKEINREKRKIYRKENRDKIAEAHRKYQRENREKCRAWTRACYHRNPEASHIRTKRRVEMIRAQGTKLSKGLIDRLLVAQKWLCVLCMSDLNETGYHRDHIIPLCKGGKHQDDNIQLLCPSCNQEKGTKIYVYQTASR